MKDKKLEAPKKMLRRVKDQYPVLWEVVMECREGWKGNPVLPGCFVPEDNVYRYLASISPLGDPESCLAVSTILSALAHWEADNYQVYRVSSALRRELFTQDPTGVERIPMQVHSCMPFDCFYLKFPDTPYSKEQGFSVKGCLVERAYVSTGEPLLKVVLMQDGDIRNTSGVVIEAGNNRAVKSALGANPFVTGVLQVIQYICAVNADIKPHSQRPEAKRPQSMETGAPAAEHTVPHDRKTNEWEVGVRIGPALTQARRESHKETEDSNEPGRRNGQHTPKRPHMRAAHYHHYWTGPRDEPENRRMVTRWIAPIAIGFKAGRCEVPVVIRDVK